MWTLQQSELLNPSIVSGLLIAATFWSFCSQHVPQLCIPNKLIAASRNISPFSFFTFFFHPPLPRQDGSTFDLWGNRVPLWLIRISPIYPLHYWSPLLTGCCRAFTLCYRFETVVFFLSLFFASPLLGYWDFPCKHLGDTPGTW